MTNPSSSPKRLYLFQLATISVPLPLGDTLEMVLPSYLIETTNGRHILVDTGMSPENVSPNSPRGKNEMTVLDHLAALHLRPSDVDTLLCTHFDVDHCGFQDSFPHAELIVQRQHYEVARSGHQRFAPARKHWDHPSLRYRLIDGDLELLPGLTLLETPGHAPGHQSVLVRLPKFGRVLLAIDAVMLQRLFTMERKASPKDDNEEQLLASTKKLLDLVEREQAPLTVFGHDGIQWQSLKKSPEFYE